MASSSASRKRTKKAIAQPVEQYDSDDNSETGFLIRWFGDNMESINEYHKEFSHKTFVNPKFLRMEFLRNENLNQVVDILKFQKLERFVKLSGNIYPDLVKVFLTNLWIDDGVIYSQVKRVDMAITDEVWLSVAGLRDAGTIVSRANVTDLGAFDKVQFFKSCLKNPNSTMRSYSVGGLSIIPRRLSYIVIWILTPRGFNHAVLTEDDLILMYCLVNKIKVNWVSVIKEQLVRIRKKPEFKIPYAILIFSFIEYYDIDAENELSEEAKAQSEITVATLNKIGLKKVNGNQWICKATAEEDETEGAGTSTAAEQFTGGDMGTGEQSFSRFEQLMINQLNNIESNQKSHHEYCKTHFQNLEERVDDIQGKLGQMFYGPED